ncbi:MAG: N-acyl homoserine lactonase family protein [Ilumatobacteraceae bacterium]
MGAEPFTLYAIHLGSRSSHSSFASYLDFEQTPTELAYFCWLARNDRHTVLIDTGPGPDEARRRGVEPVVSLAERLAGIEVSPGDVDHVVLTHLHWDHAGNLDLFPSASVWVQDDELSFWSSPVAAAPVFQLGVEADHLTAIHRARGEGRVHLVTADVEVVPGMTAHGVGGHTPGSQIVTVDTTHGRAVLASDIAFYSHNVTRQWPTAIFTDLPAVVRALDRVRRLASHPDLIVPGHDPIVAERYQPVGTGVTLIAPLAPAGR